MTKQVFEIKDSPSLILKSKAELASYCVSVANEAALFDFKYVKHDESLDLCFGIYAEGVSLDITHEDSDGEPTVYAPLFDTTSSLYIERGKVCGNKREEVFTFQVGIFTIELRHTKGQSMVLTIDLIDLAERLSHDYAC